MVEEVYCGHGEESSQRALEGSRLNMAMRGEREKSVGGGRARGEREREKEQRERESTREPRGQKASSQNG